MYLDLHKDQYCSLSMFPFTASVFHYLGKTVIGDWKLIYQHNFMFDMINMEICYK